MEGDEGAAVHWYHAGFTLDVKLTWMVGMPRQAFWLMGLLVKAGLGFTMTVWVLMLPGQPSMLEVMV